ncbi:MAG: DUF5398 family protein [Parachlamydiaceae bacterium]
MFGLEGQKKKKATQEFAFELEKELKDPLKHKEIKDKVEHRLQRIKELLRSGEDQEGFDRYALLLNGYHSLIKIMSRSTAKVK